MTEQKEITQENYLGFLKEKKLMGSTCAGCGNVDLPPRRICSKCHGTATSWIDLTGMKGTLSTFSCVHVGTQRFVDRGFTMKNPYAFGIVTLENGASLTGLLDGVDAKKPDSIKIGIPMRVTFIESTTPAGVQVDVGFTPA